MVSEKDTGKPLHDITVNALLKRIEFLEKEKDNLINATEERKLHNSTKYLEKIVDELPPFSDLIKNDGIYHFNQNNRHDYLLALFIHLTNHSMKAYKQVQNVIGEVDDKISSEFCYLARAETSIIHALLNNKRDLDFELALMDAITSTRHIINDCLDVIAIYANTCYISILDRYDTLNIDLFFEKFEDVEPLIQEALTLAAETRFVRGTYRIEEYLSFIEDSEKFPLLIKFSESYPKLLHSLNNVIQKDLDNDQILKLRKDLLEQKISAVDKELDAQERHNQTIDNTNNNAKKHRNLHIIISTIVITLTLSGLVLKAFPNLVQNHFTPPINQPSIQISKP